MFGVAAKGGGRNGGSGTSRGASSFGFGGSVFGGSGGFGDEDEEESFEARLLKEEGIAADGKPERPEIDEEEWKRRVMEDLVESFSLFDIDGNGKISLQELMAAMASVGNELTPEDAADILEVVDIDGDGEISFEEFKECMYDKLSEQTIDEDLQGAFNIFDEDGDGFISPAEIQLLFKKLGEMISTDEAVEIMKDCDLNKDGLIDFEEFKLFYMKIFDNTPTLAEQLEEEERRAESLELARGIEKAEREKYPQSEIPDPADYK